MTPTQYLLIEILLFIVIINLTIRIFKRKKQYWLDLKTGNVIDKKGNIVGKEKNGKIEWYD